MKPFVSLIDFIMIHEGKNTLRYIKKQSLKEKANDETLLKILRDNKNTEYGKNMILLISTHLKNIKRKFLFLHMMITLHM